MKYNKEIEGLIKRVIEDGKVSYLEEKVLMKKAEQYGINFEELELEIEYRIAQKEKTKERNEVILELTLIITAVSIVLGLLIWGGWALSHHRKTFDEFLAEGKLDNAENVIEKKIEINAGFFASKEEENLLFEKEVRKRKMLLFDAYFQNKDYENAERMLKDIPADEGYKRYQQLLDLYYYREDYERAELIAKSDTMLYKEYLIKRTTQILTQSGKQEALIFFNHKFSSYDWGDRKEECRKDIQDLLNSYK